MSAFSIDGILQESVTAYLPYRIKIRWMLDFDVINYKVVYLNERDIPNDMIHELNYMEESGIKTPVLHLTDAQVLMIPEVVKILKDG